MGRVLSAKVFQLDSDEVCGGTMKRYIVSYVLNGEAGQVIMLRHDMAVSILRDLMSKGAVNIYVTGPSELGPNSLFKSEIDEITLQIIEIYGQTRS